MIRYCFYKKHGTWVFHKLIEDDSNTHDDTIFIAEFDSSDWELAWGLQTKLNEIRNGG